jgi:hypothetical protein
VIAQFDGLDHAFHSLLGYGAQAEVLAPRALRERIAAAAAETAALYAAIEDSDAIREDGMDRRAPSVERPGTR